MAREVDDSEVRVDRRDVLIGMGVSSVALAVSACGDSGTANADDPIEAAPTATPATPTGTGAQPAQTPTSPPAATPMPPTPPAAPPEMPATPPQTPPAATTSATTPEVQPTAPAEPVPAPTPDPPAAAGGAGGQEPAPVGGEGGAGGTAPTPEAMGGAGGQAAPEMPAPAGDGLMVPPWDDVPMCTASRTDGAGQGPFFIHNEEKDDDIDLFRQDIRGKYNPDAEDGIEMHLSLRILDSTSTECNGTPVAGAHIYIWHTDGQGFYSGFGNPGDQKPDQPYAGTPNQNDLDNTDRFCRGAQITDENGVVTFRTFFPGWYNGRDVHIHFVALREGTPALGRENYSGNGHLFTTQFYFEPELTDEIHKSAEPYLRRTTIDAYQGAIQADENNNSGLRAKATFANGLVVAQMQILLDPAGTAAGGGGGFGF